MFHENIIAVIIQIILIAIIIVQTSYIGTQMRYNRRVNQYTITREWHQKLRAIYHNNTTPNLNDPQINDNEFLALIDTFRDMHPMFKDKLLKPSDFTIMFLRLYVLTQDHDIQKSDVFRANHLQLQNIFDDFNKDVDVIMYLINSVDLDMMEKLESTYSKNSFKKTSLKEALKKWPSYQKYFKFAFIILIKIRKREFFKLKSIDK